MAKSDYGGMEGASCLKRYRLHSGTDAWRVGYRCMADEVTIGDKLQLFIINR